MKANKIEVGTQFKRSMTFERGSIDQEKRTIELAFSSEFEVDRFGVTEILDHNPQSVRLDRLNDGAAVLVEHDTRDQVGVIESARIDGDRVGRATIRFGQGARATEIFNDVTDGIRKLISVGYVIHDYKEERKNSKVYARVTDWEPYEVSIVAIPADSSVGVGRSVETKTKPMENTQMSEEKAKQEPAKSPEPQKIDRDAELLKIRKDEGTRVNQIRAMAEQHDMDDLGSQGISEGWSYEQFNRELLTEIGKRNAKVRETSTHDGDLDLSKSDKKRYSFLRLMNAIANPQDRSAQQAAAFEMEVSDESVKRFGSDFKVRGAFIPTEVLARDVPEDIYRQLYKRDLSAGTATDGAELVADNLLAGSFIDVLRNSMVTAQAGARMLPGLVGNVDIPRKTSGSSGTWISAEDGDATQSEAQFDQVSMTPKDLAVYTQVTRRLLMQSTPAIEGIVRDDLAQGIGLSLDLAGLYGSGASGQPTGVSIQAGINTFNFAGAAPTYAETIRMIKETMTDNALLGNLGYIIDPAGWEDAMTTEKASGTAKFIMSENNTINGYRTQVTNQVTAEDWFFGNWADLLIGEWGGVELNVDPYTHSLKGKIRYIVFKTADIAVRHATSFCKCNDGV